ncbi:LysR family transcriptional regulator [Bosea sp. (in: a-proteobacteria)]|uniref:LysR family transcriptional regulator n=1 Tax=Bosea sp. (in: a-proteobacteria) TaxID=1871050 RepID=UPI0026217960|nr:LysR family transcriptional regulator [Bosea sp. (in: a-proteobacteria)]MCO5089544.1 LysR family transcriptional regulator [Bosea sp. (in: a-proteobacteria)]
MRVSRKLIPAVDNLRAFESAARFGSFTLSASELNLTQSAVSRQIKELETQIGVRLFERVRQRVVLSDAGKRFLPEVRHILVMAEDLMMRTMASSQSSSSLSIAALPTFGTRWLLPRLHDFIAQHPGIAVNVGARSHPFDFSEEPFDLAIHYGQPVWARASCLPLCREVIVPVASSALIEHFAPRCLADLASMPLLHVATRPKAWADWFDQHGVSVDTPYRGHRFDLFTMVIEAALSGLGAALLPVYLIERELDSGQLRTILDNMTASEFSYHIVVPDDKKDNRLIVDFCNWARDCIVRSPRGWG